MRTEELHAPGMRCLQCLSGRDMRDMHRPTTHPLCAPIKDKLSDKRPRHLDTFVICNSCLTAR